MRTPEYGRDFVYDFEVCDGLAPLKKAIAAINGNCYELICVTPFVAGVFVVFFRRPAP